MIAHAPADMYLAQSISGLAAQALNEGRSDEGVWIRNGNNIYESYLGALCNRLKLKGRGTFTTWELVNRFRKSGIIKGYILYDLKKGDNSINLATIQAGLKQAILISESQEANAKVMELPMLFDARHASLDLTFFEEVKSLIHPGLLVISNPEVPNNRDYAIAHKSFVYYGVDSLLEYVLKSMPPLSTVIGWNKGDEFKHISVCTLWGHINTVSDYCLNLPMLSLSENYIVKPLKSLDPRTIQWNKSTPAYTSFVMSDGDNMQWTMNQFMQSKEYWANDFNKDLKMGFTTCVNSLLLGAPDVFSELRRTQPALSSVVEYGGGYYYPDLFAKKRSDRWDLLRQFAVRLNNSMKLSGIKVLGLICRNVNSEDSKKAFRIFAEEIETLTGIIAVQYSPYNGGNGELYWTFNRQGIAIPILTAKYQLWANLNKPGSGNPEKIASLINSESNNAHTWTIVHAWSRFNKDADGSINDVPKGSKNGMRGVTPVHWISKLLNKNVSVVSIEELLWRVRMEHHKEQTLQFIK
ncbi:hypothetical protein [Parafilimonas sp.]|uniref:hypothetical protein n=1 Tax=Parafilimonas sp. TaxID=1969739 RepID=UPI0039E6DEF8